MLTEIPHEQLAAALDQCAHELLARQGFTEPPVDAVALARQLQMEIVWDRSQAGRARTVRRTPLGTAAGGSAIALRPEARQERRQWAVAHEIGEAHAHQVYSILQTDPADAPSGTREWVANQLANRILIPTTWFLRDALATDWDLLALKQRYATASNELIARRMLECEPHIIITICDQGRPTFRRSNHVGYCGPMTELERACWESAAAKGEPARESDEHGTVTCWPIHEPDWKREIMRSTQD